MHMTTTVTGTHVPTTSVKNHSGRNPAAEKKFRLDRRIAEISGQIASIEAGHASERASSKSRARRALTNLNNATKAHDEAVADIAEARAKIAELEASLPILDASITKARLAHETAASAVDAAEVPDRHVAALQNDVEKVQRRLALHVARYPEVAGMIAPANDGSGDEGDSDTGDEDSKVA
jgi:chromosome segregation ATPase